jgi:hypothetical protein
MTPSEEELAGKLGTYLDRAAGELRPGIAYRLQQARAQAVGRMTENTQTTVAGGPVGAYGLAGAGAGGGSFGTDGGRTFVAKGKFWLAAGLLALAILGWQQWVAWQEIAELEDIDAQILTSDLPIDALVDRGFRLFLEIAPTLPEAQVAPAAVEGAEAKAMDAAAPAGAAAKPAE